MDEPMRATAYEFGDFRVDLVKRSLLLRADGRPLPVSARAFDTLLFFLEHPGELLDKSTLMAAIWPKVVVEENNLNQHISALRRVLGERPEEHRFIVTVPGRGYRFVATVHPIVQDTSAPAQAATPVASVARVTLSPPTCPPAPLPTAETSSASVPEGPARTRPPAGPGSAAAGTPSRARMSYWAWALGAAAVVAVGVVWYIMHVQERQASRVERAATPTSVDVVPARRPRLAVLPLDNLSPDPNSVPVQAPSQLGPPANVALTGAVAFAPPPHSIAVLPFVNLSGDKEQEYFSDGLTEELLNSLAHIDGLQVAARTSSFSFREHPDIADVAHKLNVGTVLEGSVRRSGHTVRISAQLINAVTGFHRWSKTYDRDLGDVLKLQTEIATAVASALEVTLLGDVGAKIELGGTRNPAAFDAYLRALKADEFGHDAKDLETAIAGYSEAIRLDPNYALAFAGRSIAWTHHAEPKGTTVGEDTELKKALADARQAVTVAPELAEGHLALHLLFNQELDFAQASVELQRAVALAPGNASVLVRYGRFAVLTGHTDASIAAARRAVIDAGIAAARRAVILDPLNPNSHYRFGHAVYFARRYAEAVAAFSDFLVLDPQSPNPDSPGFRGLAYYGLGDFDRARTSCEARPDNPTSQWCLALTYQRLARRADAEIELAKLRGAGYRWAYPCAAIYAQWGNTSQALESLESAWRLRVPELRWLKADPLMDPLRKEPRFQAIERALKFPN
jgi:TolB-like protein/DNA-binding winged helix-turn-helix (wHTH) protein